MPGAFLVASAVTTLVCAHVPSRLTRMVLDTAFDQLGFSDERKAVFARDFEIRNLDYSSLWSKTVQRSYAFFASVAVFQLFAILPRYSNTHDGQAAEGGIPLRALSWLYLPSINASYAHC